jgi:predicted kinase
MLEFSMKAADYYRQTARQYMREADATNDPDTRKGLVSLAKAYNSRAVAKDGWSAWHEQGARGDR